LGRIYSRHIRIVYTISISDKDADLHEDPSCEIMSSANLSEEIPWIEPDRLNMMRSRICQDEFAGVICRVNGCIVAYSWISRIDYYEPCFDFTYSIGERSLFLFDDFVDASVRGRGLHKKMIAKRLRIARDSGCGKCYVSIDPENIASTKAYLRLGAIPEERIGFTVFLGKCTNKRMRLRTD
jgi:RimJ/RimL family protein N-acetyltransferase